MSDERLASARLLEECEASIRELQNQNAELLAKHTLLQSEMLKLTQELMAIRLEPKSPECIREAKDERKSEFKHDCEFRYFIRASLLSRQW